MSRTKRGQTDQAGDVLSTKEAAAICKVALSTIVYWFDKGLIRGYRTPGGHRRIFRSDLEEFMNKHEIPIGRRLADGSYRVLIVSGENRLADDVQARLASKDGRVEIATADSSYQAGRLVTTFRPDLVLLDLSLDQLGGEVVCRQIKDDHETRDIEVVAVSRRDRRREAEPLLQAGAVEVLDRSGAASAVSGLIVDRLPS